MTTARHVLFVDDDPKCLAELETVASKCDAWKTEFTTSPVEALDLLSDTAFDAVISDMAMPEMTGAELLERVRQLSPTTARLILSGPSELSALMRAVGPCQQWMPKPGVLAVLLQAVEAAIGIRDQIETPRAAELVGRIQNVPSLPDLYTRVLKALEEERALSDVGEIVAEDIGMTAKILQLVNSPFFGISQRCEDPVRAATLIGGETLQSLVLAGKLFESFQGADTSRIESAWLRAQTTATIVRTLCRIEKADPQTRNQASLAAFLHDVGVLLIAGEPELSSAAPRELDITGDVEQSQLGATHGLLGAYLLQLWGFSNAVVNAVAYHHKPSDSPCPNDPPLIMVHVAEVLARLPDGTTPDEDTLAELGLDAEYLDRHGARAKAKRWIAAISD